MYTPGGRLNVLNPNRATKLYFSSFFGENIEWTDFFALTSVADFEPQSGLQDNVNNPDQTFDKSPSEYKISKYVERFFVYWLYGEAIFKNILKIH